MKALIVGATGLIGGICLDEVLNDDQYSSVEIWVRNYSGKSHSKLRETLIDFNCLSDLTFTGIDHVFCCLGTTMHKVKTQNAFAKVDKEYVAELAKFAERSACQKFLVISSIGANKSSKNFYLRTKGEMEGAVISYTIPAIYILRPSMLLGNRKEFRFGEMIGKALMIGCNYLLVGKLKKYRGIYAATVAKAMIKLAKRTDEGVFILESDEIERVGG